MRGTPYREGRKQVTQQTNTDSYKVCVVFSFIHLKQIGSRCSGEFSLLAACSHQHDSCNRRRRKEDLLHQGKRNFEQKGLLQKEMRRVSPSSTALSMDALEVAALLDILPTLSLMSIRSMRICYVISGPSSILLGFYRVRVSVIRLRSPRGGEINKSAPLRGLPSKDSEYGPRGI